MNGYNYMNDNVYIGEVIGPDCESVNNKLTVTSKATVQPVALMRLNVLFLQAGLQGHQNINRCDLCSQDLEFSRREGYDDIRITGERLSMAIDFKVWVGIIEAFSKYGLKPTALSLLFMSLLECAALSLRDSIPVLEKYFRSFDQIRGKTITFTRSDSEGLQKFP